MGDAPSTVDGSREAAERAGLRCGGRQCRDVPGYELFQYYDEAGGKHVVDSADVNASVREVAGDDYSAKDFRTWAGTIEMVAALTEGEPSEDESEGSGRVTEAVKRVAERLGNTPAVCRECYIHAEVVERYLDGTLAARLDPGAIQGFEKIRGLTFRSPLSLPCSTR